MRDDRSAIRDVLDDDFTGIEAFDAACSAPWATVSGRRRRLALRAAGRSFVRTQHALQQDRFDQMQRNEVNRQTQNKRNGLMPSHNQRPRIHQRKRAYCKCRNHRRVQSLGVESHSFHHDPADTHDSGQNMPSQTSRPNRAAAFAAVSTDAVAIHATGFYASALTHCDAKDRFGELVKPDNQTEQKPAQQTRATCRATRRLRIRCRRAG
jgi:hypothetical protein